MTVFVDMDGVLANFEGFASNLLGGDNWKYEVELPNWGRLSLVQDLYAQLEPMPDAFELWDYLIDTFDDVQILTAIPKRAHFPEAVNDKRNWIYHHFGKDVRVNFGPYAYDKQFHLVPGRGDVLIDDTRINCEQWDKRGGLAILHKNANSTISLLTDIYRHV